MKTLHYYSPNQNQLDSNPSSFEFDFRNEHFIFHTDDGVFSKKYIDYGSYALLKAFIPTPLEGPYLDMGAGYGPIGIVLARLFSKDVYCCEVNQRAYRLALKNVSVNQVPVTVLNGDLYDALPTDLRFASIVTNPPIRAGKSVVYAIYDGAFKRLLPGGELWVVIQKKQGAPSSYDYIKERFQNCEIVARDKGYYILKAVKNKAD